MQEDVVEKVFFGAMAQIAKWARGSKESLVLAASSELPGELVISEQDWKQDMLFVTVTIWNPLI